MQQIALMKKVQFVIAVQTRKIRFGLFIAPVELRWLAFGLRFWHSCTRLNSVVLRSLVDALSGSVLC